MSAVTTISTHVLDTSLGVPAANIAVTLARVDEPGVITVLANGTTNADGRVTALAPADRSIRAGRYRLCFDVVNYFAGSARASFYGEIGIDFVVSDDPQHYHVPLLLSPFGYSTYRGS